MVKIIHICLPQNPQLARRIDTILNLTSHEKFKDVTMTKVDSDHSCIFILRMKDVHYPMLLKQLEKERFGVEFGVIDTYSAEATKPEFPNEKVVSKPSVAAIPIAALREQLWESCHMSLDYFVFIFMASIIAGCGLATDNSAFIVASMIISPLMAPLLGIIFGLITRDFKMMFTALLTIVMGTIMSVLCGFLIGVCFTPFVHLNCQSEGTFLCWPNFQIRDRGAWSSLAVGVFVSAASGGAASLAFTQGIIGTLVGVAISASLLPPVVNVGMMFSFGLFAGFMNIEGGFTKVGRIEAFKISGVSMLLFLVNDAMIILSGAVVLLFKGVGSLTGKKKSKLYEKYQITKSTSSRLEKTMLYFTRSVTHPDFSILRSTSHSANTPEKNREGNVTGSASTTPEVKRSKLSSLWGKLSSRKRRKKSSFKKNIKKLQKQSGDDNITPHSKSTDFVIDLSDVTQETELEDMSEKV